MIAIRWNKSNFANFLNKIFDFTIGSSVQLLLKGLRFHQVRLELTGVDIEWTVEQNRDGRDIKVKIKTDTSFCEMKIQDNDSQQCCFIDSVALHLHYLCQYVTGKHFLIAQFQPGFVPFWTTERMYLFIFWFFLFFCF